jgi:hypothetical protein
MSRTGALDGTGGPVLVTETQAGAYGLSGIILTETAFATSTGEAGGTAAVSGVGAPIAEGAGEADGTATASGTGSSVAVGVGEADGTSTANAVTGLITGTGEADGSAIVAGVGEATAISAGEADGSATVAGAGAAIATGIGEADGASTVSGAQAFVPTSGPVFFTWVDATDTTFDPTRHNQFDEVIFKVQEEWNEGDFSRVTIEMKNPQRGLLNPAYKQWAWIAWKDVTTGHIWPIGLYRAAAVPTDIKDEVITVIMIARPTDFWGQKLALAETLRVAPYYSPVFVSLEDRASPDAALQGYSRQWYISPITHVVDTSDVLTGEDGTQVFQQSDTFYNSTKMVIGQTPLTMIRIVADVSWTQFYKGILDLGSGNLLTHLGSAIIGGWPKAFTGLSGGWSTRYSFAYDFYKTDMIQTVSYGYSWQNQAKKHQPGDTMSFTQNFTTPWGAGIYNPNVVNNTFVPLISNATSRSMTYAYISPDPDVQDQPTAATKLGYTYVIGYNVRWGLELEYQASRSRTETCVIVVQADVQPTANFVATSPEADPDQIPEFEIMQVHGANVGEPVLIPIFSGVDQVGFKTTTGVEFDFPALRGAVPTSFPTIGYDTTYPAGTIAFAPASLDKAPFYPSMWVMFPSDVTTGTGLRPNGLPYLVTLPNGEPVTGPPDPPLAGVAYEALPGAAPIGLLENAWYFPSVGGISDVEFLINKARARLRMKSRVAETTFDCDLVRGVQCTLRQNALLYDYRFPGDVINGKIIKRVLTMDGDEGIFIATLTIGSAVGNGNTVTAYEGTPEYGDPSYMGPDYQRYDGATQLNAYGDVAFTPPYGDITDDGLNFPLTAQQAVIGFDIAGLLIPTTTILQRELANASGSYPQLNWLTTNVFQQAAQNEYQALRIQQINWAIELSQQTPFMLHMALKPVDNGPFSAVYFVTCGLLSIEKQIDLES